MYVHYVWFINGFVNYDAEINLMDFRPSVIAFAAILAASDDQLTRNAMEIKMSVIPSLGSLPKVSFPLLLDCFLSSFSESILCNSSQ